MPSNTLTGKAALTDAIGQLLHQLNTHPEQIPEAVIGLHGLTKYLESEHQ